ncbi:MAG: pyridoxamine 5'-phosphate oxidase family protein [Candidatus Dormibacteraeota bacterium]|nr:pyridoxamine 5'-phosphate oxidase family protein [Candidatus Dormibacteraeota bacterium]
MSTEEAGRLLMGHAYLGRIAFFDGAGVHILPVNYLAESERSVVFVTASRSIIDAVSHGADVAFEVDDSRSLFHSGWSVVARGHATEVTGDADLRRLRRGPLRSWAVSPQERWVRIDITEISGRRIREH